MKDTFFRSSFIGCVQAASCNEPTRIETVMWFRNCTILLTVHGRYSFQFQIVHGHFRNDVFTHSERCTHSEDILFSMAANALGNRSLKWKGFVSEWNVRRTVHACVWHEVLFHICRAGGSRFAVQITIQLSNLWDDHFRCRMAQSILTFSAGDGGKPRITSHFLAKRMVMRVTTHSHTTHWIEQVYTSRQGFNHSMIIVIHF